MWQVLPVRKDGKGWRGCLVRVALQGPPAPLVGRGQPVPLAPLARKARLVRKARRVFPAQ